MDMEKGKRETRVNNFQKGKGAIKKRKRKELKKL
jgi:hypothetical protein